MFVCSEEGRFASSELCECSACASWKCLFSLVDFRSRFIDNFVVFSVCEIVCDYCCVYALNVSLYVLFCNVCGGIVDVCCVVVVVEDSLFHVAGCLLLCSVFM